MCVCVCVYVCMCRGGGFKIRGKGEDREGGDDIKGTLPWLYLSCHCH